MTKPTGRPYIAEYDAVSKCCERCGSRFYLRDKQFQSFNRFQKRRFCSAECSAARPVSDKDWIMARVEITENGCWEWSRTRHSKGYGNASRNNKSIRAHRYAYEIWNGPIPDGMMVLHSCDNPPCCNPDHLRLGTAHDNMMDAIRRGRAAHLKRKAA
jgi:hypothetical protein